MYGFCLVKHKSIFLPIFFTDKVSRRGFKFGFLTFKLRIISHEGYTDKHQAHASVYKLYCCAVYCLSITRWYYFPFLKRVVLFYVDFLLQSALSKSSNTASGLPIEYCYLCNSFTNQKELGFFFSYQLTSFKTQKRLHVIIRKPCIMEQEF